MSLDSATKSSTISSFRTRPSKHDVYVSATLSKTPIKKCLESIYRSLQKLSEDAKGSEDQTSDSLVFWKTLRILLHVPRSTKLITTQLQRRAFWAFQRAKNDNTKNNAILLVDARIVTLALASLLDSALKRKERDKNAFADELVQLALKLDPSLDRTTVAERVDFLNLVSTAVSNFFRESKCFIPVDDDHAVFACLKTTLQEKLVACFKSNSL